MNKENMPRINGGDPIIYASHSRPSLIVYSLALNMHSTTSCSIYLYIYIYNYNICYPILLFPSNCYIWPPLLQYYKRVTTQKVLIKLCQMNRISSLPRKTRLLKTII